MDGSVTSSVEEVQSAQEHVSQDASASDQSAPPVSASSNAQQEPPADGSAEADLSGAAQLAMALSAKQREVLDLLLLPNPSITDIARQTGVHRGTISRWLKQDENFIAAYNARIQENVTLGHGRMLSLIPKAISILDDALDAGDARIAMQLLKSSLLVPQKPMAISSARVAEEQTLAEQRRQLELEKQKLDLERQQLELERQKEELIAQKKEFKTKRYWRQHEEKPFLERYEESRRWFHQSMAQGPVTQAKMDEIDARVAAAVAKAASQVTNPGVEQPRKDASPEASRDAEFDAQARAMITSHLNPSSL